MGCTRVFFGSFPSEIRPEHVSRKALRLVKKYCANNNIIVGAQSGSDRVLDAAKRGHGVEEVKRAARLAAAAEAYPRPGRSRTILPQVRKPVE